MENQEKIISNLFRDTTKTESQNVFGRHYFPNFSVVKIKCKFSELQHLMKKSQKTTYRAKGHEIKTY